ncbi:MAG TPA: response regulator transcription factor [Rhizomicrobium sp.]|nr:response regulator transcription factor [Rhizomicrobium sp.]
MRALLIENDLAASKSIEAVLHREGIYMDTTNTGEDGMNLCRHYDYDIVILGSRLPDMRGLDVIRGLRKAQIQIPILVLSFAAAAENQVRTLDAGADDHLTMPFHNAEMVARVRALVRRSRGHCDPAITTGRVTVNLASRTAAVNGVSLPLTAKEYQILELLSLRRGTTLNAEVLINHIYANGEGPESRTIELFICKLRKKLANATGGDRCIETIKTRGYLLRAAA